MSERPILAETGTPEGTRVVLFEDTWLRHILLPQQGHPELEPYLAVVLAVLPDPDHREPDPRPLRERFFKQDVGPRSPGLYGRRVWGMKIGADGVGGCR